MTRMDGRCSWGQGGKGQWGARQGQLGFPPWGWQTDSCFSKFPKDTPRLNILLSSIF
jgi:hypothetical protein